MTAFLDLDRTGPGIAREKTDAFESFPVQRENLGWAKTEWFSLWISPFFDDLLDFMKLREAIFDLALRPFYWVVD